MLKLCEILVWFEWNYVNFLYGFDDYMLVSIAM